MIGLDFTSSDQWVLFAGSSVVPALVYKGVLPFRERARLKGWIKLGPLGEGEKAHTRQFHTQFEAISAIPAVFSLFFAFRWAGQLVHFWSMPSLRARCFWTLVAVGVFALSAASLMLATSYVCGWIDRKRRGIGGAYCLPDIWGDCVCLERSALAFLSLCLLFAPFWIYYSAWAAVQTAVK